MIAIGDLKAFIGSTDADTALLIDLEAAAVEFVQSMTHRYFGGSTYDAAAVTEYHDGNDTRSLWLDDRPYSSTSVTAVKYQSWPGDTQTTIASTGEDGWVVRDFELVRKGGETWNKLEEYVISYRRGYDQVAAASTSTPADISAPEDVRHAVKQIVGYMWGGQGGAPGDVGLISETIGDYSYNRGALYRERDAILDAIPTVRQVIDHYHIPVVP